MELAELLDQLEPRTRLEMVGTASSAFDDTLLYREFHYVVDDEEIRHVAYRNSLERPIADKLIFGGITPRAPALVQEHHITGERISVSWEASALQMSYQENPRSRVRDRVADISPELIPALVIDAGFNALIRDSWRALSAGSEIRFDFMSLSRQRPYPFTAATAVCSAESMQMLADYQNAPLCFRIAPAAWWLRQLVDPIELVYSAQEQRLLAYLGLGNIADAQGRYQEVRIRYEYR